MLSDERDLLIIVSALCGLIMVGGALLLLYRGIIKLEPPGENASDSELSVYNVIKIKTNVAALCLFLMGFAFLWLGFHNTPARAETAPLELSGQVLNLRAGESARVSVCGGPWPLNVLPDGRFSQQIWPALDQFQIEIGKVGVLPEKFILLKKPQSGNSTPSAIVSYIENNSASIGTISLELPAPPPPALVDNVTNAPVPTVDYATEDYATDVR